FEGLLSQRRLLLGVELPGVASPRSCQCGSSRSVGAIAGVEVLRVLRPGCENGRVVADRCVVTLPSWPLAYPCKVEPGRPSGLGVALLKGGGQVPVEGFQVLTACQEALGAFQQFRDGRALGIVTRKELSAASERG